MSPLEYDAKIVKEFGIDKDLDLDQVAKLGFARTQFDEIKKMLWRERVDLQLAEEQSKTEIEALAAEARNKVAAYRNNIKGYVKSLKVLKRLVDELENAG